AELLHLKFVETDRDIPQYGIPHLVFYTGNFSAAGAQKILRQAESKDIILLENLRFWPGEESNDPVFAKKLASLADIYVNDAFSVDHRAAASVVGVTHYLDAYCGPLLEREIKGLDEVLHKSRKPFVLLMGGIKISDKVATIRHLGEKADKILLGGGLANLFYLAKDYEIGLSTVEREAVKTAWELEKNFKSKLLLPADVVVANKQLDKASIRVCEPFAVGKQEIILDAGPKTILSFAQELKSAKTIVWNGPLGLFERKPFDTATMALARVIGGVASRKAYAAVGGGETVDAVRLSHQFEHMDHVSTGGGAMLEYLAGKKLPGIEALK
ncbi:MAG TPA: phosphoglycerate kinase, partial [Patescibacteria group bacterium]|nr:phosphoglycerate kinase [Patescibacteria group bacterium]